MAGGPFCVGPSIKAGKQAILGSGVFPIHHFHEKAKSSQDAVADFPWFSLFLAP